MQRSEQGKVTKLAAMFENGKASNAERRNLTQDTSADEGLANRPAEISGRVAQWGGRVERRARPGESIQQTQTVNIVQKNHIDVDRLFALQLQLDLDQEAAKIMENVRPSF